MIFLKSLNNNNHLRRMFSSKTVTDPWTLKSSYSWFLPVQTRWKDNDQYGHMNNAVYHAIFDTVINVYLIRHVGLDVASSESPIGYMLKGNCTFLGSAKYPDVYLAGLGIQKIGNTSLTYKLGLFNPIKESDDLYMNLVNGHNHNDPVVDKFRDSGIVLGDYTHVFVDPVNKRPTPFCKDWIPKLENLLLK